MNERESRKKAHKLSYNDSDDDGELTPKRGSTPKRGTSRHATGGFGGLSRR